MKVYPRVCGGTRVGINHPVQGVGLSPRVRGNRFGLNLRLLNAGSIPACAGEPVNYVLPKKLSEVYPRVCGGTLIRS